MKKISTLVVLAAVGFAAPAFAQTPSDLRSNPFLLNETKAVEPAKEVAKTATPATKASSKKHHHHSSHSSSSSTTTTTTTTEKKEAAPVVTKKTDKKDKK